MKINLARLITKDLAVLGQRVVAISDEPAFIVIKGNPLLEAVRLAHADYDAVFTKKVFSGKGVLVADADIHRDTVFAGFKDILVGYSKLDNLPFQQDAKDIYAIVEEFGIDLDRYTYSAETAQLQKLLEKLAKPEYAIKIDRMQLTAIVTELRAAQANFELLFNEQAQANAELRLMESASSIRKNLETALRNYFNVVKAMRQQAGWKELYAKLDEIVKAANSSNPSSPKTDAPTETK
jgi:hypothetical protein